MVNKQQQFYNKKYAAELEYKYKTNTRYQRYLIKLLEKHIAKDCLIDSVCDIGCGSGLNTEMFVKDFPNAEILGIDFAEQGIAAAKTRCKDIHHLHFQCGDANDLSLQGKSYTLVTAFELLEHIEDWKAVGELMVKLSSAYIMVSSPVGRMREYEVKHGHVRNFKKGELEAFFESQNFVTVKTYYAGFPFWSPITRDLLNFMSGDSTGLQQEMTPVKKFLSVGLYYLYRYCSSIHYGDQFIGLFAKKELGETFI